MSDFFLYLQMMFKAIFANIGLFLKRAFGDPWSDVPVQFVNYRNYFNEYSPNFGFLGWLFYVIFILIVLSFFAALGYLFYRLVRHYLSMRGANVEKEKLIEQIQKLNYELYMTVAEKNRLLNLKVGDYTALEQPLAIIHSNKPLKLEGEQLLACFQINPSPPIIPKLVHKKITVLDV